MWTLVQGAFFFSDMNMKGRLWAAECAMAVVLATITENIAVWKGLMSVMWYCCFQYICHDLASFSSDVGAEGYMNISWPHAIFNLDSTYLISTS